MTVLNVQLVYFDLYIDGFVSRENDTFVFTKDEKHLFVSLMSLIHVLTARVEAGGGILLRKHSPPPWPCSGRTS